MKNSFLKIIPIVLIGYCCFVAGRIFSAREAAEPETVETITLAAQEALQNKNYTVAVQQFNRALALQPDNAALHGSLGMALAEGGRTQDAIGAFQQCLLLNPQRFDIEKQLGMALYKFERFQEAKQRFESVVSQRPNDAEAYEWLFTINNRVDQQLDNLPVLERLAELRPDDLQYRYAQIMVYHQNDLFEDALQAFDSLPPAEQESSKGQYVLAAIHVRQQNYDTAIELLEQLVSQDPEHADAEKLLKDTRTQAAQAEKFAADIAQIDEAIETNPDDPERRFNRGYALIKANRPEEAAKAFEEGLARLDPSDAETAKRLARILYELEQFDMAQQYLEKVAETAEDIQVYELLLAISTRRNQPLENIPILEKMAQLSPEESKYVAYQLGIYLENNMPAAALEVWQQLPEAEQQEPKYQHILGVVHYLLKNYSEAAEVLTAVVSQDPDNQEAKKILELCRTPPGS